MREIVENWWNGYHGSMARVRVRLCLDGGRWSVEREGPRTEYELTPCFNEAQARAELQRLLSEIRPADWRRINA